MKNYKIAVLTSHPIQHQVPLFKKIIKQSNIDLMVYYCCTDHGLKNSYDVGFGISFKWDIPLLDGYKYNFLKNYSITPSPSLWGQINLDVLKELRKKQL